MWFRERFLRKKFQMGITTMMCHFVTYLSYSRLEMIFLSRQMLFCLLINVAVKSLYIPSDTCVSVLVLEMLGCDHCKVL